MKKIQIDKHFTESILSDIQSLKITKLILIDKEKGLPLIFRTYERHSAENTEESGKDTKTSNQVIISAFISAILMFAESTSQDILTDIGMKEERHYIREKANTIASIAFKTDVNHFLHVDFTNKLVDEMSSRIFEAYNLVKNLANVVSESNDIGIMDNFGFMIDNIIMEVFMNSYDGLGEEVMKQALARLESGSTYMDPSFQGKTEPVQPSTLKRMIGRFFRK